MGSYTFGASAGRASAAQAEPAAPVRGRIASGKSLVLPAPARLLPLLPTVDSMKPGLGIRDSGFVEAVLPAFTNPESLLPNHGLFNNGQRPGAFAPSLGWSPLPLATQGPLTSIRPWHRPLPGRSEEHTSELQSLLHSPVAVF